MIAAVLCGTLPALLMGAALAQSTGPALEVASVKKHKGQQDGMARFTVSGSNVTVVALQMHDLILEAFNLKPYQVSGEQDWMGGGSSLADMVTRSRGADSYDISAKAEGGAALTRDQGRVILQAVLADRFHLKVHRETKDLPVYALVVGKNGPRLKESAPDAKFAAGLEMRPSARMTNTKTPMARLAEFLSIQADRPVVDRTGLTGVYDFTLEWNLTDGQQSAVGAPKDADSSGPSLFTAVQEQLGLKLETAKAPIEILVIDHAQKPTGN